MPSSGNETLDNIGSVYARRRIDWGDLGARGVAARRGAQPGRRGAAGTCSARSL